MTRIVHFFWWVVCLFVEKFFKGGGGISEGSKKVNPPNILHFLNVTSRRPQEEEGVTKGNPGEYWKRVEKMAFRRYLRSYEAKWRVKLRKV